MPAVRDTAESKWAVLAFGTVWVYWERPPLKKGLAGAAVPCAGSYWGAQADWVESSQGRAWRDWLVRRSLGTGVGVWKGGLGARSSGRNVFWGKKALIASVGFRGEEVRQGCGLSWNMRQVLHLAHLLTLVILKTRLGPQAGQASLCLWALPPAAASENSELNTRKLAGNFLQLLVCCCGCWSCLQHVWISFSIRIFLIKACPFSLSFSQGV